MVLSPFENTQLTAPGRKKEKVRLLPSPPLWGGGERNFQTEFRGYGGKGEKGKVL